MNVPAITDTCRDDATLRMKFFEFTRRIFPNFDFSEWYKRGFWREEYVPHMIVRNGEIISNVSATRMNLIINGDEVGGVQIGTVGTVPEYRGQGFSRVLMEHVIEKYADSTDIMFLFADDEVLDFYPKFGFKRHQTSLFKSRTLASRAAFSARQLRVDSWADMTMLQSLLNDRIDLTRKFGATDYAFITQWHILNIFSKDLFYVEEDDVAVVVRQHGEILHVIDVICRRPVELVTVLSQVMKSADMKSIVYHFPSDQLFFDYDEALADDDCPLFVRGEFGISDREFKFPVTAQT